jgi:hypothetical protein
MESPRQGVNQSFEAGRGPNDFREEFNIDPRGPIRGGGLRPRSNINAGQPQGMPGNITADINLPPSISQDKLMRFNANVDGKALLHDLDQKFESQDRMITYLISQLNSMDQTLQNLNRKA